MYKFCRSAFLVILAGALSQPAVAQSLIAPKTTADVPKAASQLPAQKAVAPKAFAPKAMAPAKGGAPERVAGPVEMGPALNLIVGKSTLLRLPQSIERISIGNPGITDVTLISNRELYLIGKTFGTTNIMLWHQSGGTTVIDVTVQIDTATLQDQLRRLLPTENRIEVRSAAESIVLAGSVSSQIRASEAVEIAEGFIRAYTRGLSLAPAQNTAPSIAANADGSPQPRSAAAASAGGSGAQSTARASVINLMKIDQPMQVMIEVKVAEVSRTFLEKIGVSLSAGRLGGEWSWNLLSNLAQAGSPTSLGLFKPDGRGVGVDAEKQDGLVKILAEPSLVAISGQEAGFLAGGKIFIPVARTQNNGIQTIALEEKEYGVSLRFLATVLDKGNISLRVAPEISELNQSGNPFTTLGGVTTILPGFTTRRANTQVILGDGQSLAIAGLIKNNVTQTVRKVPALGELPILGALFRSTEFQNDRTELLIVVTPRLIKALDQSPALPTDSFVPPSRSQNIFGGRLEGSGHSEVPADKKGLELK
jgi:pilus assembly protein CpaC